MDVCKSFTGGLFAVSAVIVLSAAETQAKDTVTDEDGNVYSVVKIGNQIWTAENLRATKLSDGTPISYITGKPEWTSHDDKKLPAYCWYENDTGRKATDGALYNWYAVKTGKLAPKGWHVATDADWIELEAYLADNGYNSDETKEERKVAKAMAARTGWSWGTTIEAGAIGKNLSLNNRSGFSAFPGGFRLVSGNFRNIGTTGRWWSATEYDSLQAWRFNLRYESANLNREYYFKGCGFSVRAVKDIVKGGRAGPNRSDAMAWIDGGTVRVKGEGPGNQPHDVKVNERVAGNNPSVFKDCPKCPVEQVSWLDAKQYCEKVGKRLPTEAEWEYACRAGVATNYYWGDEMNGDYAWYRANAEMKTHPAGQRKPNKFRLYDMSGNVYEWCSDDFSKKDDGKNPGTTPGAPGDVEGRVYRGGSWNNHRDGVGCSSRVSDTPEGTNTNVGFRCAR
jgi:uncharacterized protein (TIGR02145 family)